MEVSEVVRSDCQYSWNDGDVYYFIDNKTFEEIKLDAADVDCKDYLVEGDGAKLISCNDKIIAVEVPINCDFEVTKIVFAEK